MSSDHALSRAAAHEGNKGKSDLSEHLMIESCKNAPLLASVGMSQETSQVASAPVEEANAVEHRMVASACRHL